MLSVFKCHGFAAYINAWFWYVLLLLTTQPLPNVHGFKLLKGNGVQDLQVLCDSGSKGAVILANPSKFSAMNWCSTVSR